MSERNKNDTPTGTLSEGRYAVVVGVNNSSKTRDLRDLEYAESDAHGISYLLSQKESNFLVPDPPLVGLVASTANVRETVVKLIRQKKKGELLLFYFIGHGYPVKTAQGVDAYLVTADFDPVLAEEDPASHLSLSWLRQMLFERNKTADVVVVLDCCHAGYIAESSDEEQLLQAFASFANSVQAREGNERSERSWAILTSAGANGVAREGQGHTLMTGLILTALSGRDRDALENGKSGDLTLQTLHSYLEQHMNLDGVPYPGLLANFKRRLVLASHPASNPLKTRSEEFLGQSPQDQSDEKEFFDRTICRSATINDLNADEVQKFFLKGRVRLQNDYDTGPDKATQLREMGMLREGHPNYGTLLCFSDHPASQIAGARIHCMHWGDTTRTSGWAHEKEYEGSLLEQYRQVSNEFLRTRLDGYLSFDEEGERDLLPFRALQEALLNALIHREYVAPNGMPRSEEIKVEIFRNRVEISSPGAPPDPVKFDFLKDILEEGASRDYPGSHPRNPQIQRIFYLAGDVEKTGSGIQRIRQWMENADLPIRVRLIHNQTFIIILYLPPPRSQSAGSSTNRVIPQEETVTKPENQASSSQSAQASTNRVIPQDKRSPKPEDPTQPIFDGRDNSSESEELRASDSLSTEQPPNGPTLIMGKNASEPIAPRDQMPPKPEKTSPTDSLDADQPSDGETTIIGKPRTQPVSAKNQTASQPAEPGVSANAQPSDGATIPLTKTGTVSAKDQTASTPEEALTLSSSGASQSPPAANQSPQQPPSTLRRSLWSSWPIRVLIAVLCVVLIGSGVLVAVRNGAFAKGTSSASSSPTARPTTPIPPASTTIEIASDLPTSGLEKANAVPIQEAIQMAITEANNNSLLPGYTLKLVSYDDTGANDRHDPQKGAHNVQLAIDDNLVAGIIGPMNSSVAQAEMPVTNQAAIAQISPNTTNPCLTKNVDIDPDCSGTYNIESQMRPTGQLTYFRLATPDDIQGKDAAQYFFNTQHYQRVILFKDSTDTYSRGLAQAFQKEWQILGGQVSTQDMQEAVSSEKDYQSILQTLIPFQPDLIYFAGNDPNGSYALQALANIPEFKNVAFAGGDALVEPGFLRQAANLNLSVPMYGSLPIADPAHSGTSLGSNFESNFIANGYTDYFPYIASAYDCTKVLIQAIKTVLLQGTSTPHGPLHQAGAKRFREAVLRALEQNKYTSDAGLQNTYSGATGTHSFDSNGDTTHPAVTFYQVNLSTTQPTWQWLQEVGG